MKTPTEIKFDKIIKNSFQEVLSKKGFKKKGNNFYIQLQEVGHIINIQKSQFYSKDNINFTINTGIFIPEYWRGLFYNKGKQMPTFPIEPACLIRKRIGTLSNQNDTWYTVNESTDENTLIAEMKEELEMYILPYFASIKSKHESLSLLKQEKIVLPPLGRLIVYGELQMFIEAKAEYEKLLKKMNWNPSFLETIKDYAQKYGVI